MDNAAARELRAEMARLREQIYTLGDVLESLRPVLESIDRRLAQKPE